MSIYIGVGFNTEIRTLYEIADQIGIDKYSILHNKEKIINYLKEKFSLSSLYIVYNFDLDPSIIIFNNIIENPKLYYSIDSLNNLNVSEGFKKLKKTYDNNKEIKTIIYYGNELLE